MHFICRMKEKAFIGLFFCFLVSGCGMPERYEDSDLEERNLYGHVKKVRIFTEGSSGYSLYEYNRRGNITAEMEYEGGELVKMEKNKRYNKNGDMIKELYYPIGYSWGTEIKYENTYDDNGNLIEQTRFSATRGPHVENNSKLEHGYRGKRTYSYDDSGNLLEEFEYNETGLTAKTTFKYDSRGNQIEVNQWNYQDSFNSIRDTYRYEFDDKGNRILQQDMSMEGKIANEFTYRYDTYGNVVERQYFNVYGKLANQTKYEYSYDEQNNWIERRTIDEQGNSTHILKRTITYY